MKLSEILESMEASYTSTGVDINGAPVVEKAKKPEVVPSSTPRNFVAKHAQKSGAGSHSTSKFTRKTKHKPEIDIKEQ